MGYPNQPWQPQGQPQGYGGPPAQQGYGPPQGQPQQGYAPQAPAGYGGAPGAPAAGGGSYNFGDLWTGADKTAGELLPNADYDAVVDEASFGQTRSGDKGAWTIRFRVTTGPAAGRPVTMTMAINPTKGDGTPNPAGMGIMFRQLHAMGVPVPPPIGAPGEVPFWEQGWTEHNVAQAITGKPVLIKVVQNDWEGGTNNKIRDIKPARPGAPTQVQQGQPQAQAPATGGYQPGPPAQGFAPPPGQPMGPAPVPPQQPYAPPAQDYPQPGQQFPGQVFPPQQAPQGPPPQQWADPAGQSAPGPQQAPPAGPAGTQPPWAQGAPPNGAAPQAPQQAPPAQPQQGAPPAPPWGQQ